MLGVKERVLLVDDEPQILVALEDLLSDEYTVLKSETPERALELVRADHQIAVVITDQRMPHMNGDEFLRKIGDQSHALRIMVSGFADLPAVLRAVNDGKVFAYVTKPWNEQDLLGKVHSAAEHFRLAEELEYERGLLRDLMDNSPDGIYFKDNALRFLRTNHAFAKAIGARAPSELVGLRLSEVLSDEHQPLASAIEAEDRLVLQKRRPIQDLVRRSERAGRPFFSSETKAPISSPSGDAVGLVGISRDVTERVLASEALCTSEARLQQQTGILNSVLNGMGDGVVVTALGGQTLLFNERASRVLGVGIRDVPAETWPETYGLCLADGKTPLSLAENPVCRAMSGEPLVQAEVCVKNAGTRVAITATPLKDPSGAVIGAITLLRDVTQQRSLEQKLAQSQRMEAIGQLAGGVAHDFNNLLTVIVGCGELALEDLAEGNTQRDNVDQILAAARHATLLTQQLLAFSRQQIIHPKDLQLNDIVTGMESILRRLTGEQIRLALSLPSKLGLIAADQSQIEQVILNLVVNARDAMPEGGELGLETAEETLSETAAAELGIAAGGYVALTVTDNGAGMTEATQKHLFEPFFTTKEFGKGTGLGLSTVYGIVRQNAGHIRVQSTLGEGTEFKILLPRSSRPEPAPGSIRPAAPAGSATILLIESDSAIRLIAAKILRADGYCVLEASRIGEARRLLAERVGGIDLFLTDIGPKGAEFGAELSGAWPKLRTVFMTGGAPLPKRDDESRLGKSSLLAKPFSRALLLEVVRAALSFKDRSQRPNAS